MSEAGDDTLIRVGTVTEALPDIMFRVELEGGSMILAKLAGKMRYRRIRVLVGDKVRIELNQYDSARGRIIYRL